MPSISTRPDLKVSELEEVNKSSFGLWKRKTVQGTLKGMDQYLLAKEDEEIIGYASIKELDLGKPLGFIGWIVVRPNFRDKGVGTKLAEESLDYFREREIECIYAITKKGNKKASNLLRDAGFEETSLLNMLRRFDTLKVLNFYLHAGYLIDNAIFTYKFKD